jgi:GT2 family glycosyltransferase
MNGATAPLVSVLFITYSRFDLLEHAVRSFRAHTDYPEVELVIADDGSPADVQKKIRTLPADVFALAPKNCGLGANNNNGLRHCSGKYILMIQDDWHCDGPSDYLRNAVAVLEANPDVGLLNFAGAPHPADLTQRLEGSDEPCYATPRPFENGRMEHFLYSDQPHIQTRAALEHVGFYKEDRDMEECEIDYNFRWRDQGRFQTAVFPAYYMRVFSNKGEGQSFRTGRFRYRVQGMLQPFKPALERISPRLFRFSKAMVQAVVRSMERLRLVR